MKTSANRAQRATWILALAACLLGSANRLASADEPVVRWECCPVITNIPCIDRLFKKSGTICESDAVKHEKCAELCERIGVDFDFDIETPRTSACCSKKDCCATSGASCGGEAMITWCNAVLEAMSSACEDAGNREQHLIESLVATTRAAADAKARLETWKEASATEVQLRQELAEARINNAQLVARLQMAEEKLELVARLHQAQAEIAALKGEVAAAKTARGETGKRTPQMAERSGLGVRD
jgi:hypothetical protein